ncbi:MAG: GNAT family N-acetyltransferase [Acidimicrobiales bacterium]
MTNSDEEFRLVPMDDPVARSMEDDQRADMAHRYGAEGPERVDASRFEPPDGAFIVVFRGEDPVGCGGFRPLETGVAELKLMRVDEKYRRRGLARRLLLDLERRAALAGYGEMRLVTGTEQPEAVALYESSGYRRVLPFGEFRDAPEARAYGKPLKPVTGTGSSDPG